MPLYSFVHHGEPFDPSRLKDSIGRLVGQQASNRLSLYRASMAKSHRGFDTRVLVLTQDPIEKVTSDWKLEDQSGYNLSPAQAGDVLQFKLRTTLHYQPTGQKVKSDWMGSRQVQGLSPRSAAEAWFARREDLGFTVSVQMVVPERVCFEHKGNRVQYVAYDLHGTLTVKDPNLFRQTVANGIGREKAFGCGLLLVSP